MCHTHTHTHTHTGLETLGELSRSNIPCLLTTSPEMYQRIFQLLTLSDCELILISLDSLYNLSTSVEIARKIIAVDRSCEVLVNLLTSKTEEFGSEAMKHVKVVENETTQQAILSKVRNATSVKGQGSTSLSALATSITQFPFRKQGQSSSSKSTEGTSKVLKIGNSLIPTLQGNKSTSKQGQLNPPPLSGALTTLGGQKVIPVLTIQQLQDLLVKNVPGISRMSGVSQSVATNRMGLPLTTSTNKGLPTSTSTVGLPLTTSTVAGSNVRVNILKSVDNGSLNTSVASGAGQSSLKTENKVLSLQPQVSTDTSSRASTPDSYSSTSSLITGATLQRGTTPISVPPVKSTSPMPGSISISSSQHSVSPTGPSTTSSPHSGMKTSVDTEEFTRQW